VEAHSAAFVELLTREQGRPVSLDHRTRLWRNFAGYASSAYGVRTDKAGLDGGRRCTGMDSRTC
jgi:hypothetical protein